jgi:hypothetical protein
MSVGTTDGAWDLQHTHTHTHTQSHTHTGDNKKEGCLQPTHPGFQQSRWGSCIGTIEWRKIMKRGRDLVLVGTCRYHVFVAQCLHRDSRHHGSLGASSMELPYVGSLSRSNLWEKPCVKGKSLNVFSKTSTYSCSSKVLSTSDKNSNY